MYIAYDGYGELTGIEEVDLRNKYYCIACRQELTIKYGDVRQHHFAHKIGTSECTDTWHKEKMYGAPSEWHRSWQNKFPKINQEKMLSFGDVRHRADVVVGKTILELQHSAISQRDFANRTNFYKNCGGKVIWLFDLIEEYSNSKIVLLDDPEGFCWSNARRCFNYLDNLHGMVDLFFQISDDGEKAIAKIERIVGEHYEIFIVSKWYTKGEFLEYVGLKNGKCKEPCVIEIDKNPKYLEFCEKYGVQLSAEQDRAVQMIDGAVLLLAVPGSGKTTTLITRLAFMTLCENVKPEEILALTYTNAAVAEMRGRLASKYGDDRVKRIAIRTINSLCDEIMDKKGKSLINNNEKERELKKLYKEVCNEYPSEADIMNLVSEISFTKNMMVSADEIAVQEYSTRNFREIFARYEKYLNDKRQYEFDDQLVYAYKMLKENAQLLAKYRNRYKYICVDEAQDTSKIQHEIVKLLVGDNNNIFMVGDEDQSIYGFRGAYPKALLEFCNNYSNPFVMNLSTNYRSYKEITDVASTFIKRTGNRYDKRMVSSRGIGGTVEIKDLNNRYDQYEHLLEMCKNTTEETAFIYRNNDSAIPLIDLLNRAGIKYHLNNFKDTFFTNHVLTDYLIFFKLIKNPDDVDAFMKSYYKFGLGIEKELAKKAVDFRRYHKMNVLESLVKQTEYGKMKYYERAKKLLDGFTALRNMSAFDAINYLESLGYGKYVLEKGYGVEKIELLKIIARKVKTIDEFIKRIEELSNIVKSNDNTDTNIILTTIHSCKGMEYTNVCVFDVIAGVLPSRRSKEVSNASKFYMYDEERRLFYVAMTRAKNNLKIINVLNSESEFIRELKGKFTANRCLLR